MGNVRKLLLLAMIALAAMAIGAPTTSGQVAEDHETLEITNEETGLHCPAVNPDHTVDSGCLVHASSEAGVILRKHVFGIESTITTCNVEAWGRVNEDAEGYALHIQLSGAGCQRQPCKPAGGGEPNEWPAHGDEAHSVDPPRGETGTVPIGTKDEIMTITFCIEPIGGGTDETCEIDAPVAETAISHQYEFGQVAELPGHGVGGFRCELVGHWLTETDHTDQWLENDPTKQAEDAIEATHVPAEDQPEVSAAR